MSVIEDMFTSLSGGHGATTPLLARTMRGVIGSASSEGPGLPWLLGRLERAGLGPTVASWIGAGPNMPISAGLLHAALGDHEVQSMAARAGLSQDEFVAELSEHLPGVIARLTPGGQVPADWAPAWAPAPARPV